MGGNRLQCFRPDDIADRLSEPSRRYGRKLAVTNIAAVIERVQVVPENESQPSQPVKVERKAGVARRVTTVPLL